MWEQYPFCNLDCFWHIDQHITNGSVQKRATHHGPAVTSQWYPPRSYLTESGAARLHIGLLDNLNARPHCLRRFYHARTVAECKYPFPTFIAYFTSALCETENVTAHLTGHRASSGWYGSPPHHRKQRNS